MIKLDEYVKFCFDFIPEEERILHYAACDVAVFPSYYEPFGIVALEAMAWKNPSSSAQQASVACGKL